MMKRFSENSFLMDFLIPKSIKQRTIQTFFNEVLNEFKTAR